MTWYRLSKFNGGIITHTTRRTQSRCICRRGVQERGSGGDHIARHDMTLHFMILSHQESTGHAVTAGNRPVRVCNQNRCTKKHKARKDSLSLQAPVRLSTPQSCRILGCKQKTLRAKLFFQCLMCPQLNQMISDGLTSRDCLRRVVSHFTSRSFSLRRDFAFLHCRRPQRQEVRRR